MRRKQRVIVAAAVVAALALGFCLLVVRQPAPLTGYATRSADAGTAAVDGGPVGDAGQPPRLIEVKVFFLNNRLDPEISCQKVFPVVRRVPETQAVAMAALTELLSGPTGSERAEGYATTINAGVTVQQLVIENGVARVDFDKRLEEYVGGSCRVTAIRAQITATLKQFPTVREVVISIDGRSGDILQP
jgi:spore germination protein GerM